MKFKSLQAEREFLNKMCIKEKRRTQTVARIFSKAFA